MDKQLYNILEVTAFAKASEIEVAYQIKLLALEREKALGNQFLGDYEVKLKEAYLTLIDPETRLEYDRLRLFSKQKVTTEAFEFDDKYWFHRGISDERRTEVLRDKIRNRSTQDEPSNPSLVELLLNYFKRVFKK